MIQIDIGASRLICPCKIQEQLRPGGIIHVYSGSWDELPYPGEVIHTYPGSWDEICIWDNQDDAELNTLSTSQRMFRSRAL